MRTVLAAIALLASAACASAQAPASTIAITNVSVIPMDTERVLEHQTVIIRDGLIAEVGAAADVRVPDGALNIDGRGKYLMPGLSEMHAHVPGGPNATPQAVRDVMFLYLANGITVARSMLGAPPHLELRRQLADGAVIGPTLIAGAPSLNGNSAPDPATARDLVIAHANTGYDFLKLHPGISAEVYDTIVAVAARTGITLGGHVSADVGLDRTLHARQGTIDHLDGYVEAVLADSIRQQMEAGTLSLGAAMRTVGEARITAAARATRDAGVFNVPTAALWESLFGTRTAEEMLEWQEMRYASPQQRNAWTQQRRNILASDAENGITADDRAQYLQVRRRVLKALADEAAPLLLMGTDAPQLFSVPGFSLHREIALLDEVGLAPFQILAAGTRNVAAYTRDVLQLESNFGVVKAGNRADLILLDANPLAEVRNVSRIAGVMVRGRWQSRADLDRQLEALAVRYAGGAE